MQHLIPSKTSLDLRGSQYEGGAAFTEAELYMLQNAFACARDWWLIQAKKVDAVMLANAEAKRYDELHQKVAAMIESED